MSHLEELSAGLVDLLSQGTWSLPRSGRRVRSFLDPVLDGSTGIWEATNARVDASQVFSS